MPASAGSDIAALRTRSARIRLWTRTIDMNVTTTANGMAEAASSRKSVVASRA